MNTRMIVRRTIALGAIAAMAAALTACTANNRFTKPTDISLMSFDSCTTALTEFRAHALKKLGSSGWPTQDDTPFPATDAQLSAENRSAEKAAQPDYSGTNTHEPGIDEPDFVKTDGRRVVTLTDGVLRVIDAKEHRITGMLDLTDNAGMTASQLLLDGNRALVVFFGVRLAIYPPSPANSRLALIDLNGTPKIVGTLALDGEYLDARQMNNTVRVIVRSRPHLALITPDNSRSPQQALRKNQEIIAKSTIDTWLPQNQLTVDGQTTHGRVPCHNVQHPANYTGSSILTVLTFNLREQLTNGDPVSIVADGGVVYATDSSLYVANQNADQPQELRTELYKFDISGDARPRFVASGVVPGALLNQYALSEFRNHLRVATMRNPAPCCQQRPDSESAVYVLAEHESRLDTVGSVGGLGKGERLYAIRFFGPAGYVVTFREMDPLYALDLSNPTDPKVTGELKITGYSAYLHPVDETHLIGVGQEATESGQRLGSQVSLFNVGTLARPERVAQYFLADAFSEAEFDPHAFLYWPKTGTLVIPVMIPQKSVIQAIVLDVEDEKIIKVGVVQHPGAETGYGGEIQRSLIIGETLWTFSRLGALVNNLHTLDQLAWIRY